MRLTAPKGWYAPIWYAPIWCAPVEIDYEICQVMSMPPVILGWKQEDWSSMGQYSFTDDWSVTRGTDAYAVDCWMCGGLVEVEQLRFFNGMGERLVTDRVGYCEDCGVSADPPSPKELAVKVERAIEALGPWGWYWWLKEL